MQPERAIWRQNAGGVSEPVEFSFSGVRPIDKALHGQVVRIHGRLMYNFDESAIYPIFEESDVKPLWMSLDKMDSNLHFFLMTHDQSAVSVTGKLDTLTGTFDQYNYEFSIRDINVIEVVRSIVK
ncbi:hypothetical protein LZZ85_12990 [Terrimonas sp. NA20]|uniref:Uncharacterized protein n=1 Tax=Terrimonas ginsenosidimutans TaxID=2908004 RepID=A0ABS9KSB8_9BACT|nr:hypothetical protein [Terrimonas ginsenosidimutans]MCG2615209.1 hypothetical protein [Terrimonas ginsenosidimutans]